MHAEVRGRNRAWKVWIPNAAHFAHTIPFYDLEGNLKETLLVGEPPGKDSKYVECYGGPFSTTDEAVEYARYLGYEEVKVIKTLTKQEALAKARAARTDREE